MPWYNPDGLLVRFDLEKVANKSPRGEAQGAGDFRTIDCLFDLTQATAGTFYTFPGDVMPENSFIAEVSSDVITAAAGTTGVTFGVQRYNGTEYDYDGFLTAVTGLTTAGTHTTYSKGTSGAGALVGTTSAYPGILGAMLTGTPTGGRLKLAIRVFVPSKNPVPLTNT